MYFSDELSYVRTRLNAHEGKRLMGRLLNTCVFCNGDKIGPIVGFIFNFGYTNPAMHTRGGESVLEAKDSARESSLMSGFRVPILAT